MKITQFAVGLVMVAACAKTGPKTDTFPGRQLGESTASPGENSSKPQPVTPDDPRVMNVSAGITPAQAQAATQAPLPAAPTNVSAPATAAPAPAPAPSSQTVRAPSAANPATSSTPVTQPTDIAPATTTPDDPRPGVFSPPPPPPQ
jgi:eukaryotic-like serine/threonine-protein kinase